MVSCRSAVHVKIDEARREIISVEVKNEPAGAERHRRAAREVASREESHQRRLRRPWYARGLQ